MGMDPEKDTLFRGEFEVVKELIAAFEDGPASKAECDKVIDKNGPPPKGTGIKQLREQSKIAKDAGAEEFKLSGGKASVPTENLKLAASFCTYMDAHPNFRTICEEGKGKLQWERDIPQDALDNLVSLANADFHANLGKIIHDIYLTGHNLFKDMPQGDHKKRAKYRFASKTLMRILPDNLKTEVENLINQKTMTLDLYEILGQCTWGQGTKGV